MTDLITALRSYQQADEEGVMVLVSRQACEEAATEIERLGGEVDRLIRCGVDLAQAFAAQIHERQTELFQLRGALTESLKLQSHYAKLLNDYDGGKRMRFADNEAWMARLAELEARAKEGAPG